MKGSIIMSINMMVNIETLDTKNNGIRVANSATFYCNKFTLAVKDSKLKAISNGEVVFTFENDGLGHYNIVSEPYPNTYEYEFNGIVNFNLRIRQRLMQFGGGYIIRYGEGDTLEITEGHPLEITLVPTDELLESVSSHRILLGVTEHVMSKYVKVRHYRYGAITQDGDGNIYQIPPDSTIMIVESGADVKTICVKSNITLDKDLNIIGSCIERLCKDQILFKTDKLLNAVPWDYVDCYGHCPYGLGW